MKIPKFSKLTFPRRKKKLQATARRVAAPPMEEYEEEPTTKLSTAFVVVLLIHVVAVGGIYAFQSIKSKRRADELLMATVPPPMTTAALSSTKLSETEHPVRDPGSQRPEGGTPEQTAAPIVAPISKSNVYQVKNGDTLGKIAASHGVTVAALEEANQLKPNTVLRQGQTLNLPAAKTAPAKATADTQKADFLAKKTETAPKATAAKPGTGKTYVVAKGDSPLAIARKLGVSYDDLLKLNKIDDPRKLQIGQTLQVPAKKVN